MRLSERRAELVRAMPSVSILGEANGQWSMVNGQWSITPSKGSDIFALTLNGIGVSCANIPAGYHLPHKDDEYTVIAELEHTLAFIRHFVTTEHRRFPHTYKTYTQQMIEELYELHQI